MAIRPVDLQLSYMAAPQNAAVLNAAQEAPQAAQAAAAAQFAAELAEREEHIEQPSTVTGAKVRRREHGHPSDEGETEHGREHRGNPGGDPSGEGEHLIDVTA